MKKEQGVSQRQYAQMLGVSNEAVRKAIKNNFIVKGFDGKFIYPKIANKEWGDFARKPVTAKLTEPSTTTPNEPKPNPKATNAITITGDDDFGEARRKKEILSAKLLALELAERQGQLVQKEAVYKELYKIGQELRSELLNVPERNIDNILASNNRSEAKNLLTDAILQILEKFSKHAATSNTN